MREKSELITCAGIQAEAELMTCASGVESRARDLIFLSTSGENLKRALRFQAKREEIFKKTFTDTHG